MEHNSVATELQNRINVDYEAESKKYERATILRQYACAAVSGMNLGTAVGAAKRVLNTHRADGNSWTLAQQVAQDAWDYAEAMLEEEEKREQEE